MVYRIDDDEDAAPAAGKKKPTGFREEFRQAEPVVKVVIILTFALLGLSGWVFYCTAEQAEAGWWAALGIPIGLAVVVFTVVNVWKRLFVPVGTWPALGLGAAVLWLYSVGSYDLGLDLAILAVSFLTPALLSQEFRHWLREVLPRVLAATTLYEGYRVITSFSTPETAALKPLSSVRGFKICAVFLLMFWLLCSLADGLGVGKPLDRDPEHFARLRRRIEEEKHWPRARVGLALSGGGYRAVLMHAGVLDGLERMGVPVTNISTVSGGSIVGAYYATGGSPAKLRDAVTEGRFKLTRSLTDVQNLSRLPFPFQVPGTGVRLFKWYDFSRTDVQAELLEKVLLGGSTFARMKAAEQGAPELMVCATDLRSGALYGFHRGGVLRRHVQHPREKKGFLGLADGEPAGPPLTPLLAPGPEWFDTSLARVVAASGAFPGAFNAIREKVAVKNADAPAQTLDLLLADGGITDNSALSIMEQARQSGLEGWRELDLVLSSDASALLAEDDSLTALGELTRAVDIIYANIGGPSLEDGPPKILLSPGAFLDTRVIPSTLDETRRRELLAKQVFEAVEHAAGKMDEQSLALFAEAMSEGRTKKLMTNVSENLRAERGAGEEYWRYAFRESLGLIRPIIGQEITSCSHVFLRTSTLTDRFEQADARDLFRLGQFLVALNWHNIKAELLKAEQGRDGGPAAAGGAGEQTAATAAGADAGRPRAEGPRAQPR